MDNYTWYKKLKKPSWAPPNWVFGPVWSFLYVLIAVSFGKVFLMFIAKEISFIILVPFILNLIFNFIFTPIQFGLKNNIVAFIDILLVWLTLLWCIILILPVMPWIAYMQIPYILWVTIATVLQFTITKLNWKK